MIWSRFLNSFKLKKASGINQKVLVACTLILIIAGGFLLYSSSSSNGVHIEINPPQEDVLIGVPFELEARFLNNSSSKLNDVRIALNLPEGLALFEDSKKVNVIRDLGEVSPGGVAKESFIVIALPSDNERAHTVVVSATYSSGSLSAEFSESKEQKINVKNRDINIEINLPETIFEGQEFQASIKYKNVIANRNENLELPETILALEASQELVVISDNPSEQSSNRWTMESGEENEIPFVGRVGIKTEDVLVVKGKAILKFGDEEYVLAEKESETILAPSPLTFSLSLGDPKDSALPGEFLTYNVRYRNNTSANLKDVVIKVQLVGEMFDISTLNTNASFNDLGRTITWSSNQFNQLREVKKGDEETFSFSIRVKQNFSVNNASDKNFIIKAKGSIESPTVTQGLSTDRTASTDVVETKITSLVKVDAKGYFRDAPSGVLNQGPLPPKVGQETNYSIHWELMNYGNDVEDVVVKTRLEEGVVFEELVSATDDTELNYNSATREIIWRLGKILASTGILTEKPEAIFQIGAIPGVGMVGQYMPLLEVTTVSARDMFTNIDLTDMDDALDTRLVDDKSVGTEEGKVTN
ncbi:hypothetical protein KKH05_03005 [Patescibacteria group bacterium]|nr:hypothetical protein [Patescibacteria group bacterium]